VKMDELQAVVQRAMDARAELERKGTPPGDAMVMAGLALGVLLSGDR